MSMTKDEFLQKMLSDLLKVVADSKKDAELTDNGIGAKRGYMSIPAGQRTVEAFRNRILATANPSRLFTHKAQPVVQHIKSSNTPRKE